jgi:hypothetical protein
MSLSLSLASFDAPRRRLVAFSLLLFFHLYALHTPRRPSVATYTITITTTLRAPRDFLTAARLVKHCLKTTSHTAPQRRLGRSAIGG